MKYQTEILINLPRKKVVELLDNPDNMKHWQPGFKSFENASGKPGEVGSKSLIKYDMGKRKVELVETIIKRELPDEFHVTYETKGMWNFVKNYYIELDSNKSIWKSENEFKGEGIYKLMLFLMPGAFKKRTYKYMKLFKEFAEKA